MVLQQPASTAVQSSRAGVLANLSIRSKTAIVGGTGVLGLLLVGGVYFFASNLQATRQHSADEVALIGQSEARALIEMLQARRSEKDFQIRRDLKYVKMQNEAAAQVTKEVDAMATRLAALGETELAKQSQAVREGLDTYIKTFAAAPPIAAPKRLAKRSAIFSFVV